MEVKDLTEGFNKLLENKNLSETDLDDVYNCIETLNKAEFWIEDKDESYIMYQAQLILKHYLETVWS